ncbi:MAG: glycine cleavage system aminomethyltransferase GcvT [Bacteroidota bacterium]
MADTLQKTPLHAQHVALGARMMPFGGFDMPVQYSGIIDEHLAVRRAAGLFDVSHMGEVFVRGPHALAFVQHLITNDAAKLYDGRVLYTAMCRPDGGIVDDLLVYRLDAETYLLVINASNIEKDVAWMQAHNPMGAELEDVSPQIALLALQGPQAFAVFEAAMGLPVADLAYYHARRLAPGTLAGSELALVSHTGYTGEAGLEIYCDADAAPAVWSMLLEAGAPLGLKPAGLGARDTLRLEAGYCLYGNDLTDATTPLEAGLGWVTKLGKDDFVGREALAHQKAEGPTRRLVGFAMAERGIPRPGYKLLDERGAPIGVVTSGTQSPLLKQGIGLGYVPNNPAHTTPGQPVWIEARGRALRAVVRKPPFHTAAS